MSIPEDWQTLEVTSLFKNPHIEVFRERVIPPGETRVREWTIVRRKQAVVIAPLTSDGNFLLIHQARIPVQKILWEFPAGQIDDSFDPDMEVVRQTALRELQEETGYALVPGGELSYLGYYYSSQGYSDEMPHLFLARPVHPLDSGKQPDQHESIRECREFSFENLRSMIADGVIQDANTLALFARLAAKRLIP